MSTQILRSLDDLLAASDHHPSVRFDVRTSTTLPAYAAQSSLGSAVAFVGRLGAHAQTGLTLIGDQSGAQELLSDSGVRQRLSEEAAYVTVERSNRALVAEWIDNDGGDWD